MRPPSPHSTFFSSLKQVEKRLKLENPTQSFNSSPAPENTQTDHTLTESLSTPMFVQTHQEPNTNSSTPLQESSEPPLAFLSFSSQFPPIHQTLTHEENLNSIEEQDKISSGIDEIDLLMQLLGLSNCGPSKQNEGEDAEGGRERVSDECCGCESGFYEKIVGVKGPKCKKEADRLDGWISYFLQSFGGGGEERMETLRLAYLLLGKAACELEGGVDSHGFVGLDFPLAIEEFLKKDPPIE